MFYFFLLFWLSNSVIMIRNRFFAAATLIALLLLILNISVNAQQNKKLPRYGKYVCTASKYVNGSYEFIPRGSIVITKSGTYTYLGFEKKSTGKFTIDSKGNLLFKGGYLDGGKAEKIDRPDKFFVVFPTIPDHRWTATFSEK